MATEYISSSRTAVHVPTAWERKDAAIKRVLALLEQKPHSCFDISGVLKIPAATVYDYLHQLEAEGVVFAMQSLDRRGRKVWTLDKTADLEVSDRVMAEHAKRCSRVPARQMGMQRHWMDVALFGPAPATTKDHP
jgi:predicted transcriptional regulator